MAARALRWTSTLSLLHLASTQLVAQMSWAFRDPALFPGFTVTYNTGDTCNGRGLCNLPIIAANHSLYGIRALYKLDWTQCRLGHGCGAAPNSQCPPNADPACCNSGCKPCPSPLIRYGPTPCRSAKPDWRAYWARTFVKLKPYIANGSVVGINLNDEQMWDGVTVAETAAMADLIKADWPAAIVYQNEAPAIGDCNMNRMNETVFTDAAPMLPRSVDL
jgi:hypothetical protein